MIVIQKYKNVSKFIRKVISKFKVQLTIFTGNSLNENFQKNCTQLLFTENFDTFVNHTFKYIYGRKNTLNK